MNKSELIAEVASKTALPKKDAEKAVNAFIDTVKEAVANKDKVLLKLAFGMPAAARILALAKPLKLQKPTFLLSKPGRLLRMP